MTLLSARPQDDLNWQVEENTKLFEFDLGLNTPYFPLEDELYFQSLCLAMNHFTQKVWPMHEGSSAILYRGSADFSVCFAWSERQLANYSQWKTDLPDLEDSHLKRLFCAEAFVAYFQMLAHKLPDELPLKLILDPKGIGTPAETLHLLSPERFEHFEMDFGMQFSSNIGICFPSDELCTKKILNEIDSLIQELPHFRPVYEPLLTEQWDGLDEIIVFEEGVTTQGRRKLAGFLAAGGKVRGRGI